VEAAAEGDEEGLGLVALVQVRSRLCLVLL
jgi:hypothetical protein